MMPAAHIQPFHLRQEFAEFPLSDGGKRHFYQASVAVLLAQRVKMQSINVEREGQAS